MPNISTNKFVNKKSFGLVDDGVLEAEKLKNLNEYSSIKSSLETLLSSNRMKIHFFGSRIIGLADKESDLDIFVEYENNFYSDKNVERDRLVLEKIAVIINNSSGWRITTKILSASVPILQVLYIPKNLKCDISVSNGLGVVNSLMLAYIFDLQPESKHFYQFMKIFLKRYRKTFDGYLLKLLVVFFLQSEKIFPSIVKIQEKRHVTYINGWSTVEIDKSRSLNYYGLAGMKNYRSYIPKFFEFYGNFQYSKYVMSIYDGKQIERNRYQYPEEIDEHILCIFGPINRRHNIGKYPSKKDVEYFILLCQNLQREFIMKNYDFKS